MVTSVGFEDPVAGDVDDRCKRCERKQPFREVTLVTGPDCNARRTATPGTARAGPDPWPRWVGSAPVTDTPDPLPPVSPSPRTAPAPLLVAASLAIVEAIVLVVQGLVEIFALSGDRVAMGVTTTLFFVLYGAGLAFCAWAVTRLRSWARSPIVVAQLIQLAVAWSWLDAAAFSSRVCAAAPASGQFAPSTGAKSGSLPCVAANMARAEAGSSDHPLCG